MSAASGRDLLTSLGAVALVAGPFVSAALLAVRGGVVVTVVLARALPTLLGYAGLARVGAVPWRSSRAEGEADPVAELEGRYARGELDDAELERRIETLLAAEDRGTRSRGRERDVGRERR